MMCRNLRPNRGVLLCLLMPFLLSCADNDVARVVMECRSPDKAMNAIYWYWMGGGAAGWAFQNLTVVPSDTPASEVLRRESPGSGQILKLAHGYDVVLTWRDDHTLVVEYPDSAYVHFAAPGGAYTPLTPHLKVIHRGVPAVGEGTLAGGNQCKSSVYP